jgi:Trypsin-co-occurring domain 2
MSGSRATDDLVSLADAVGALRAELTRALWDGQREHLRFKVAPVELTLQVAVTKSAEGTAGVKWWLIGLGGKISRESTVTQSVKMTLDPMILDQSGHPVELFVDAPDNGPASRADLGQEALDAPG